MKKIIIYGKEYEVESANITLESDDEDNWIISDNQHSCNIGQTCPHRIWYNELVGYIVEYTDRVNEPYYEIAG